MSAQELRLEDSYGRKIHVGKFGGQIAITPIPLKIGDTIALNDEQAHWLLLYLQEHLKRQNYPARFDP